MGRWKAEELEILERYYTSSTIDEMLKKLPGRTKHSIHWKASEKGLLIRNGKQLEASFKLIVPLNLTEDLYNYLANQPNKSRVLREALALYIEKNNTRKKVVRRRFTSLKGKSGEFSHVELFIGKFPPKIPSEGLMTAIKTAWKFKRQVTFNYGIGNDTFYFDA